MGYQWGPTQTPINGFIIPPPFPPVYGAFNLTSYLQGASDYEVMVSLLQVVKGVYDCVANLSDSIEAEIRQHLDDQIAAFENKWNKAFSDFIFKYEKEQDDFLAKYAEDIQTLINNINEAISTLNAANKNYTDTEIAKIKTYIDSIDKDITNAIMHNPFTGTYTTLQQILDDFANYVYKNGFTVGEYSALGLTVEEYAVKDWTVWDYAYNGKQLLGITDLKVLAPWNNNAVVGIQEAINYLYGLHEGSN